MNESTLTRKIQATVSGTWSKLFRNNVGKLIDSRGVPISYGLCVGSSDLIGLQSVVVTPDMVGKRIAIFCAVEVKVDDRARRTKEQIAFISMVQQVGGRAGFATSVEQAAAILRGE